MVSQNWLSRLKEFIRHKLLRIDDSPHRVALGLGVGVFLGIMPGLGFISALIFAGVFRLNKLATLLGVFLTNTWLSVVTFLLSIRLGSAIMDMHWEDVHKSWLAVGRGFNWRLLFEVSFLRILLPVALGYLVISLVFGFVTYIIALFWLLLLRKKKGLQDV